MASIPFDPPKLMAARRSCGFVDVPETPAIESPLGLKASSTFDMKASSSPTEKLAGLTQLKRSSTMQGNILVLEQDGTLPQAFWLQRKIGKSSRGVIRLGYKLRTNTQPEFKGSNDAWELAISDSGAPTIVTINIMDSGVLDHKSDRSFHNPLDELSALQMIAKCDKAKNAHVVGTELIATCSHSLYSILPYHPDGTLFQYSQSVGNLDEPLARFFFRQILEGLQTLQNTGLCHRNLSLDAIKLNGDHAEISGLGWSLRFNKKAPVDEDRPAPVPGGSNPQYLAPEYFGSPSCIWDGFAADLWACGLMLFNMVVSSEALFVAPIREDRLFGELCVKGNIRARVQKYGKAIGKDITLTNDLVDLLKHMMKADPKERMSLDEVMKHNWVKNGEVVAPSQRASQQGGKTEPAGESASPTQPTNEARAPADSGDV